MVRDVAVRSVAWSASTIGPKSAECCDFSVQGFTPSTSYTEWYLILRQWNARKLTASASSTRAARERQSHYFVFWYKGVEREVTDTNENAETLTIIRLVFDDRRCCVQAPTDAV